MLRTLRRSPLAPVLRRLLAVVLVLSVSVAFAEPMIADSCDVASAQLSLGAATSDGPLQTVSMGANTESQQRPSSVPDGHTLHLCHCAHAHGGTLVTRHVLPARGRTVASAVPGRSERIPPSVIGEPQLRPPRGLTA